MRLTNITNAININMDLIVLILEFNSRNKDASGGDAVKKAIETAKRKGKYFDFTNDRDGLKTIIVFTDGIVCGYSYKKETIISKINEGIVKTGKTTKKSTAKET
jgi:hypothetical protein